ncbi:hybrid sensor histidine kinase/response regulator [Pseudodesulfovibrio indicus]|uniref:histidine kinase n=1 Tax=Pseudodesulfovibrio indicus TaxID=1716143 RepID=A0A126QNG7_9BACT|nr:hybrid sensor histidine kinase/response regulator [Pseudodesulfovibrio indicus]AMK11512.1 hybrid sensor histidine kinase/response regulator [Pseudodesulfovibrio indicus]TDT89913.1 phospho-acceptor domain-containing protein [Pseudodesulfovibrio indicus]
MPTENILLVEDDPLAQLDIKAALKRAGYGIMAQTSTGEEAIELADRLQPDVVLMDVHLEGEMDGLEAASEIRRRFDIPIIFLTVAVDDETLHWAKISGPFGYLVKPVDNNELRSAIEVGLYRHQMERELRKATRAAEAANRAKTSFLATVSHELRTPMNGVLGMTELLLMSDLEDPYRESVQLIKESSMALLSVLNQIIDYSRLETSQLRLRTIDFRLEDMISGVLSQHQRAAKAKGVTLKYTLDPAIPGWLRGDSAKLRQVLGNLLSNAVKYTVTGQILVDVSPATSGEVRIGPEEGLAVQMLVQDTGIGIPKDKLHEIFESFKQAEDHLCHTTGGLGLGLAIVSRIVAFLEGSVRCSSIEGQGSTFSVIVPLEYSRYEQKSPSTLVLGEDSPLKGISVLVAEDDLVNQRYLVRLLEKMGCKTVLVEDGEQAVETLKEQRFDLVLMDVEMPRMNGLEATRLIRRPETGCLDPKVPVVALTARAMWGDEQRCIHAGMDDYVSKPVDIDTVAAIIQSTLEKA